MWRVDQLIKATHSEQGLHRTDAGPFYCVALRRRRMVSLSLASLGTSYFRIGFYVSMYEF